MVAVFILLCRSTDTSSTTTELLDAGKIRYGSADQTDFSGYFSSLPDTILQQRYRSEPRGSIDKARTAKTASMRTPPSDFYQKGFVKDGMRGNDAGVRRDGR
jgi:hypothetical protein